jgi:probable HAF family extracellular repeat protein
MTDLGTLGGADSQADAINRGGQIVGWAQTASGEQRACLWNAGQMVDLNTLVKLGQNAFLIEATAINDAGQIVANGSNGRAYLITVSRQLE